MGQRDFKELKQKFGTAKVEKKQEVEEAAEEGMKAE